jgi:hypothetical protein
MNLYKVAGSLAVALSLSACSMDDSAGASGPARDLKFERHLKKGTSAKLDCYVYANENSVLFDMALDMAIYNSQMTMKIETEIGKPSAYTAEIGMTGVLLAQQDKYCESMRSSFYDMDGSSVECSDGYVKGYAQLKDVSDPLVVERAVHASIAEAEERCLDLYDSFKESFEDLPGEWDYGSGSGSGSSVNHEEAVSCDVKMVDGAVVLDLVYSEKSAHLRFSDASDAYFAVQEDYTGLDEATLERVCSAYTLNRDNVNVECSGASLTYFQKKDGYTLEDLAVIFKKESCPAFLSSELGLEDMWESD